MKKIALITTFILMAILTGCAKDEFSVNKLGNTSSTGSISTNTATQCSSFTLIKPHVDFLFLWDNSTSTFNMDDNLKQALNQTIFKVSERFNYRIILAPIKTIDGFTGTTNVSLIAENPEGLSSEAQKLLISKEGALSAFQTMATVSGSTEHTYDRTKYLLQWAKDQGIFRANSYMNVVVMSNGDDVGTCEIRTESCLQTYAIPKAEDLYNFAIGQESTMKASQFRFMTMVPHYHETYCPLAGQQQPSFGYIAASARINALAGSPSNDGTKPDSYNICSGEYTYIFNGINNSIEDTLIKHVYANWPIIERSYQTDPPPFDPDKIIVTKMLNGVPTELTEGTDWEYIGFRSNQWTRELPSEGEATTGYFIRLMGNGKVTYPACITINTQALADCYGYVQLQANPNTTTIALKINGKIISESTTNGWQFIGYKDSQDVKIKCPDSDFNYTSEYKTGYFLKLSGDAIYGNNAVIELTYEPSSI